MAIVRFVGPSLLLTSMRVERDPLKGFSTVYTYEGDQASIYGYARRVKANQRYSIDDPDKPVFRLTVQSPEAPAADTHNDYVLKWELLGNEAQKSMFEHPKAIALGDVMLNAIKIALSDVKQAAVEDAAALFAKIIVHLRAGAALQGKNPDDTEKLFRMLVADQDTFVTSQYVLRRTQTVASLQEVNISFSNVEKVFTTTQVLATEVVPAVVMFSISDIPAPVEHAGYLFGWLKKTPTVNQVAAGRFEISQEYWLEQWSTFVYDAATTP